MKIYQHLFLSLIIAASFAPNSCDRRARELTFRDLSRGDQKPKVIAAFQPWFGDADHIQVGYNSNDPAVIHKQIDDAKKLGVYAFAVDWYGERHPFLDRSYALIQQIAAREHFHVALMYDETEEDDGHATEDALDAFSSITRSTLDRTRPDGRLSPATRQPGHFHFSKARQHRLEPGPPNGRSLGESALVAVQG